MYKISLQGEENFEVDFDSQGSNEQAKALVNGQLFEMDWSELSEGRYHVIQENKGYVVEVDKVLEGEKKIYIRVNGNTYVLDVKDKMDLLLEKMGLDNLTTTVETDLKAPMPGLVLDILVKPGQTISKGDPLIILEAMKMENVLKSTVDTVIKSVECVKGAAVEKNEILLNFEA